MGLPLRGPRVAARPFQAKIVGEASLDLGPQGENLSLQAASDLEFPSRRRPVSRVWGQGLGKRGGGAPG